MAVVQCSGCGVTLNEAYSYFSEIGLVCHECLVHEQIRCDNEDAFAGAKTQMICVSDLFDGTLARSYEEEVVETDGSITHRTSEFSLNLGVVGMLIKWVGWVIQWGRARFAT